MVFRAPSDPAVGPGCFPCSRVVSVGPGCLMRSWAGLLGAPVGGGPPARSPHASLTARSGRSRSPARPRRLRPPQPGPSVPPPPTAAAAGPRLEAWPGPSGGDLKYQRIQPSSALPVLSPVREIIRPVWLVACLCAKKFALQGRKRRKTPFLGVLGELFRRTAVERGRWESFVPGLALGAVQSSPCWGAWWCERYKVLPARAKRAEMGLFGCVGRVLYRSYS